MPDELGLGVDDIPVEGAIAEEGLVEEEVPAGTVMTHTVDELPELNGLVAGDAVTFVVKNVSEDGKSYDLEVAAEEPAIEEEVVGEAPITGQDALESQFV